MLPSLPNEAEKVRGVEERRFSSTDSPWTLRSFATLAGGRGGVEEAGREGVAVADISAGGSLGQGVGMEGCGAV